MTEVLKKSILFEYQTEAYKMRCTPPRITHRPQLYNTHKTTEAESIVFMIVKSNRRNIILK